MAAGLRFALYVWLIVSAVALLVQLVRRRRHDQTVAPESDPAAASGLVPDHGADSDESGEPGTVTGDGSKASAAPPAGATLADLMDGISYPEALRPLVSEGTPTNPAHQCLISTTSTPERVGLALTEELESHGFSVMGVSESEAVAQRSDGLVSLSIEAQPNEATVAGVRRFPTAKQGDVVVEIWVGAGPNPTLG